MFTLLIFIAVLAVLVLTHEFGHFIVARKNGIKVEEFGFGFPPRLVGIHKVGGKWRVVWGNKKVQHEVAESEHLPGTVYSINWLPLGGFVKIKGEDAADENAKDPDSFASKKAWQKASVLVAGVLMNVITATVLLSIGFMIGSPTASDGSDADKPQNRELQVVEVLSGKPAEAAGVKPEDAIVKIDSIENPTLKDFQAYTNSHRDQEIAITIKRGEELITKTMKPIVYEETGRAGIGVELVEIGFIKYPWHQAIYQGIISTGTELKRVAMGFGFLIKAIFTDDKAAGGVSGPVGVAIITGKFARLGFRYLLKLTALLSLNLALLNILPIPALDGGRLLFVVIGKIIRRPVTPRVEQFVHMIGFLLLMALVVAVTVNDIWMFKDTIVQFFSRML